jgi:WD40 repeat protein
MCPPDRGNSPLSRPLTGNTRGVQSVALGMVDGLSVIVSGGDDGTVRLWDPRSGVHYCIEVEGEILGVACAEERIVVAATTLGLAAFQLTNTPGTLLPSSRDQVLL